MVTSRPSTDGNSVRIVARGNFSLGPAGLIQFLLMLACTSLGLAGLLAWLGYWPILMIAVLQLFLVATILVRAWQYAWVSQVIDVDPQKIHIRWQRYKRHWHRELDTAWAVISITQPEVTWYEPAVTLRSGRQVYELGAFLNREEKLQLAKLVQCAIEKHSALDSALKF